MQGITKIRKNRNKSHDKLNQTETELQKLQLSANSAGSQDADTLAHIDVRN